MASFFNPTEVPLDTLFKDLLKIVKVSSLGFGLHAHELQVNIKLFQETLSFSDEFAKEIM
jgi:hypothetical protein